jgi:SOS-response transcriptional repressor LexA
MAELAAHLKAKDLAVHFADDHPEIFRTPGAITFSRIHRAKGNEAAFVYVIGLDRLAAQEDQVEYRNQLFVALTRTRGICRLSGRSPGADALMQEFTDVLASGDRLIFKTPEAKGAVKPRDWDELPDRPPIQRFVTHLPLYDLKAAAGIWPNPKESDPGEVEWVDATRFGELNDKWFAVRIDGDSMEPRLPDGSVAIFQLTSGLPEGKVVLVGKRGESPSPGLSLMVKQLIVHQHQDGRMEYRLRSKNPAYPDIPIAPEEAPHLEFIATLKWGPQDHH